MISQLNDDRMAGMGTGRNYIAARVTSNVRALTNHVEEFYGRESWQACGLVVDSSVSTATLVELSHIPARLV